MISRTTAYVSGALGGLCWIARYLLADFDIVRAGSEIGVALRYAGATWLALALVTAGAGLVRKAPLWLRILLGIVTLVLAVVALSLAYNAVSRNLAEAVFGAVVAFFSLIGLMRGGGQRPRGSHAPDNGR